MRPPTTLEYWDSCAPPGAPVATNVPRRTPFHEGESEMGFDERGAQIVDFRVRHHLDFWGSACPTSSCADSLQRLACCLCVVDAEVSGQCASRPR